MNVSFSTDIHEVLAAFDSNDTAPNQNINQHAQRLLTALVTENNVRAAILPPTVGWFALTLTPKEPIGLKLQVWPSIPALDSRAKCRVGSSVKDHNILCKQTC